MSLYVYVYIYICICICKEIPYCKELADIVREAEKSTICSWQAGNSILLMV